MKCADYQDAIAEFVDGSLDPARQRLLERHVEGCAACRALVADLKSIQAAAFTLDRHEVPAELLQAVRARIAETAAAPSGRLIGWPRTRAAWGVWMGAAAALLLATTIGIYPLVTDRPTPPAGEAGQPVAEGELVASVQADLQAAEQHYDKAIEGLEQIARSDTGDLDPQLAAVLQKNLQVVDQSIDESRAAVKAQPSSVEAQESLFEGMRTKVALLQQTVELINEMRQGNQAEAGRLIQGLTPPEQP